MQRKTNIRGLQLSCLLIIALVFFCGKTQAQESTGAAGEFLRMGVGARALSLGGAFTGLANDASAVFWNPAGLYQINRFQFEFMNVNLPLGRSQNFLSGVFPIGDFATIGVGWISLRINGIEARGGNSSDPDFLFNNSQNAFFLSVGKSIGNTFSVGGNIKVIRHEQDIQAATGVGFDASILVKPLRGISLGFILQDIGTDLRWDAGFTEPVPMTYRLGAAWKILDPLTLVADVSKTSDHSPRFHFGSEFRPLNLMPIRIGLDHGQFTGGVGFVLPVSNNELELNYSYSNEQVVKDAIHRFSLIFTFGKESSSIRPRYDRKKFGSERLKTKERTILVKARILNVRSGPGVNFRKIAQIKKGQKFRAFDMKREWRAIQLKTGEIGWVHASYIEAID